MTAVGGITCEPAVAFLLLVTGSHHDDVDPDYVCATLDKVLKGATYLGVKLAVLHGHAAGVDTIADRWAREHGVEVHAIDAEFNMWGGMAGEIRNRKLLQVAVTGRRQRWAVRVMAFPSKASKGTWQMVRLARDAGFNVEICINNGRKEETQ